MLQMRRLRSRGMTPVQGHTAPGLGTRPAHSCPETLLGLSSGCGDEVERVQESEGVGGAVLLGLSSLRSEARNSHAPVSTPGEVTFPQPRASPLGSHLPAERGEPRHAPCPATCTCPREPRPRGRGPASRPAVGTPRCVPLPLPQRLPGPEGT